MKRRKNSQKGKNYILNTSFSKMFTYPSKIPNKGNLPIEFNKSQVKISTCLNLYSTINKPILTYIISPLPQHKSNPFIKFKPKCKHNSLKEYQPNLTNRSKTLLKSSPNYSSYTYQMKVISKDLIPLKNFTTRNC